MMVAAKGQVWRGPDRHLYEVRRIHPRFHMGVDVIAYRRFDGGDGSDYSRPRPEFEGMYRYVFTLHRERSREAVPDAVLDEIGGGD